MPKFIDQIATGDAISAKNTMSDILSAKAFEALDIRKQELAASLFGSQVEEEVEELDELSKTTLRNYLKGSRAENQGSLGSAGHMSDKARSLGRTDQDKEDSRYEGSKLAKRKLGAPGSIPPKIMAK